MRRIFSGTTLRRMVLAVCFSLLTAGFGLNAASPARAAAPDPTVRLETSMGDIVLRLDARKAPISTANFVQYVKSGFYDGTVFHRVIKNFMIQGGGLTPDLKQKEARTPIRNEANNGLKNKKYTIAMAHRRTPLGHGPVLYQCEGQRLPGLQEPDRPGLGLRGVWQGHQGPGRGG